MSAAITAEPRAQGGFFQRLRAVAAGLIVFALLHYGVGAIFLNPATAGPRVLVTGSAGVTFGIAAALALLLGSYLIAFLIGSIEPLRVLFILCIAVALWIFEDGSRAATMDDWLIRLHPKPGHADGLPYWRLLPDYILLLVVGLVIQLVLRMATGPDGPSSENPPTLPRAERSEGITALMVSVAIALVVIMILMGARYGSTYRGQVYFAVYVAFMASTAIASQITGVRDFRWFWPAPFIVGVIGLLLAAMRPGFSPPYDVVNTIPAWAPARALPLEMISIGMLGVCWPLRSLRPPPQSAPGGK